MVLVVVNDERDERGHVMGSIVQTAFSAVKAITETKSRDQV